jgi:hypothetical protein
MQPFSSSPDSQPAIPPAVMRPQAPERAAHGQALVLATIERVEAIVDAETAALKEFKSIDLREFNNRKSQALLELMRATRNLGGAKLDPQAASRVAALRAKLETNLALLNTHLKAAKEITGLVAETIRANESDGTYSSVLPFKKASPW